MGLPETVATLVGILLLLGWAYIVTHPDSLASDKAGQRAPSSPVALQLPIQGARPRVDMGGDAGGSLGGAEAEQVHASDMEVHAAAAQGTVDRRRAGRGSQGGRDASSKWAVEHGLQQGAGTPVTSYASASALSHRLVSFIQPVCAVSTTLAAAGPGLLWLAGVNVAKIATWQQTMCRLSSGVRSLGSDTRHKPVATLC